MAAAEDLGQLREKIVALSAEERTALADLFHTNPTNKAPVGHFDLLFTVLYAAVVTDLFHTIAKPSMWSFEFLLGTTLLVVVVDHWLLHFRNREEIEKHRLFSLLIIGLTLFLYAKANEVLSVHGAARLLGWKFWSWTVIPVFCTSYFMKSYYGDRDFHRKWDYIAVGACLVYIVGIISCGWTNDVKLGLASLLLAIVYVPFEVHHYASTKQSKQLPSSVVPPNG